MNLVWYPRVVVTPASVAIAKAGDLCELPYLHYQCETDGRSEEERAAARGWWV